jgi:hypothetical protein
MHKKYHYQITTQALQEFFSPQALQVILTANLGQDVISNQTRSEYHFDNNNFAGGNAYIIQQRQLALEGIAHEQPRAAWEAFGRLTHAAQDFYAHSNYVRLWLAINSQAVPEQIDPQDDTILNSPELISGRLYYPLEVLAFVPGLEPLIKPFLPRNSHTWMNLDSPRQGPLFEFAFAAARKRTQAEFFAIRDKIQSDAVKKTALGIDYLPIFIDTLE